MGYSEPNHTPNREIENVNGFKVAHLQYSNPRIHLVFSNFFDRIVDVNTQVIVAASFNLCSRFEMQTRVSVQFGGHIPDRIWTFAKAFRSRLVDPQLDYLQYRDSSKFYPLQITNGSVVLLMQEVLFESLIPQLEASKTILYCASDINVDELVRCLGTLKEVDLQQLRFIVPNKVELIDAIKCFSLKESQYMIWDLSDETTFSDLFRGGSFDTSKLEDFITQSPHAALHAASI